MRGRAYCSLNSSTLFCLRYSYRKSVVPSVRMMRTFGQPPEPRSLKIPALIASAAKSMASASYESHHDTTHTSISGLYRYSSTDIAA